MAGSQYSLSGAAIKSIEPTRYGNTPDAVGMDGLKAPLSQLSLDVATASLDLRRLAVEQGKLVEALTALTISLSSQRSLLKANTDGVATSSASKSKLVAEVEQHSPPARRKSAMANESVMVNLDPALSGDKPSDKSLLRELIIDNLKLASDKRVAPSGATSVQLAQVELAGARSGIGEGLEGASKKAALLTFARDAGTMASAYEIGIEGAGELLAHYQTSLNLGRDRSIDLGNATQYLANRLNLKAADIASVVKESGEAGIASGLQPEQVAAFAAALLRAGSSNADASVAITGFSKALSRGNLGSTEQKLAWAQLGLNPGLLAKELKTDAPAVITKVLAALNAQPAENRSSLSKTLFGDDTAMPQLAKKYKDVIPAFSLVPKDGQYTKDGGAMVQVAEARGETSQGRWNAHDASQTRLSSAVGSALAPWENRLLATKDTLTDELSSQAEESPNAAAAIALLVAVVGPLLSAVAGAVKAEALSNVGKKILSQVATRLPAGLGGLIADVDSGKGAQKAPGSPQGTPQADAAKSPGMGRRLMGSMARVKPLVNKVMLPLLVFDAVQDAYKGWREGDNKAVGRALGGLIGTLVGSAAGSRASPYVGTLVGGVVGGMAGSCLGEQLATSIDRLGAPEQVSKDLTGTQAANQQINFAPVIQISSQDAAGSEQFATTITQLIQDQFLSQFVPMMMTNPLAVRRDAALTDGGR